MPNAEIDLIEVGIRFRQAMSACDGIEAVVDSSFYDINPELEVAAARLRPVVGAAANLIEEFLKVLEKTPQFSKQRMRRLEHK